MAGTAHLSTTPKITETTPSSSVSIKQEPDDEGESESSDEYGTKYINNIRTMEEVDLTDVLSSVKVEILEGDDYYDAINEDTFKVNGQFSDGEILNGIPTHLGQSGTHIYPDDYWRNNIVRQLFGGKQDKHLQCNICKKSFQYLSFLKKHELIHTGEKPFQCGVCKKTFNQISNLNIHMRVHRRGKVYQCERCHEAFPYLWDLKNHKQLAVPCTAIGVVEEARTRIQPAETLRPEIDLSDTKLYICEICQKAFKHVFTLNKHKLIHTGEKPYACGVCNLLFNQSSNLKKHRLVHTGEKPFQCDICQKCFRQHGNLKSHLLVHTMKKEFQCNVCRKFFKQSANLKKHMLVHTGEKPFQCDVCERFFGNVSNLKKHKLIHTGEKPFHCEICMKMFRDISNLKKHKLVHTDWNTSVGS